MKVREIKFRAWLDDEQKMYNNTGVVGRVVVLEHIGDVDDTTDFEPLCWGSVDDVYVMQFTGLKDKNDKEIYEGDIIAYKGLDSRNINLVVKWSERDATFMFGGVRTDYAITGEVIGNIYENPELLR